MRLYIPIWLYSNNITQIKRTLEKSLYIPIWLYSNLFLSCLYSYYAFFTFQSGYIQMLPDKNSPSSSSSLYIPIWLYSNVCNFAIFFSSFIFTFQSGYIQIKVTGQGHEQASEFTFQSGYIQMENN